MTFNLLGFFGAFFLPWSVGIDKTLCISISPSHSLKGHPKTSVPSLLICCNETLEVTSEQPNSLMTTLHQFCNIHIRRFRFLVSSI